MGHEYRGSIAGCFLLKLSHKVAIKLLAVAAVTSKLDKYRDSTSRLTCLIVGRRQFLTNHCPETIFLTM